MNEYSLSKFQYFIEKKLFCVIPEVAHIHNALFWPPNRQKQLLRILAQYHLFIRREVRL